MKDKRAEYIDNLEAQLKKAALAKTFVESTDGKYVINYINSLVSSLTNQILNSRKSQEEYIELRAQVDILRKLQAVLTVQANDDVLLKLREKIDLAKSED